MVRCKRSVGGTNQTFAEQVATGNNGRLCKVADWGTRQGLAGSTPRECRPLHNYNVLRKLISESDAR